MASTGTPGRGRGHVVVERAVEQAECPGEVVAGALGDDAEDASVSATARSSDAHEAVSADGDEPLGPGGHRVDGHLLRLRRRGRLEQPDLVAGVLQPSDDPLDVARATPGRRIPETWTSASRGTVRNRNGLRSKRNSLQWSCGSRSRHGAPHPHRAQGMTAVHDFLQVFGHGIPDDHKAEMREKFPMVRHPVVRIHRRPVGGCSTSTGSSSPTSRISTPTSRSPSSTGCVAPRTPSSSDRPV